MYHWDMARKTHLVYQHLENISVTVLADYREVITQYVKGHNGIYALYKGKRLYYVGLASNLKGRLRSHLRDRHKGLWDTFSVYLTRGNDHMKELESLVLRVVDPVGNKVKGKLPDSIDLRRQLTRDMNALNRSKVDKAMGRVARKKIAKKVRVVSDEVRGELSKYIMGPQKLKGTIKGKTHWAYVRKDGMIRYNKEYFASPSAAACAATGRSANGWHFWNYQKGKGYWVRLKTLKR